jgi:hypothetical protein
MSSNERINTSSETEMVTDHDDPITADRLSDGEWDEKI